MKLFETLTLVNHVQRNEGISFVLLYRSINNDFRKKTTGKVSDFQIK